MKEVLEYLRDGESNEGPEKSPVRDKIVLFCCWIYNNSYKCAKMLFFSQQESPTLLKKKNANVLEGSKGLSKSLNSLDASGQLKKV